MELQDHLSFTPKYYQVKQSIIFDIEKRSGIPNLKLPSVRELMQKYNISSGTAVHVISELVKDGIAYTVQGKGCFVAGKTGNEEEKKAVVGNKRVVFICPTSSGDKYFHEILVGVLDIMQSAGYKLEVYNSEYDYSKETQLLAKCLEEPVAGLIFFPHHTDKDYKHLFQLHKKGVPIVLVNNKIKNIDTDLVGFDVVKEARKATNYLINSGHKKIVFLGCHADQSSSFETLEGYKQALNEKGIKFDKELVLDAYEEGNGVGGSGYMGLKGFLNKNIKFTAIFTINTGLAIKSYKMITDRGLKIYDDISMIGIFDNETARSFEVPVTNMTIDVCRVGHAAAKLLLKKIDSDLFKTSKLLNSGGSEKVYLKLELTKRNSIKDIRSKKVLKN